MAEVLLENVSKEYGQTFVVKNVNLRVADKEFLTLLGPSGSGKTTTMRLIAGLEKLTEGKVFIDGKLVNDLDPKDRDIAMVFQNYALYPHMSVYDNIAFPLVMRKVPRPEIDAKVKKTAQFLNILPLLKRKPKQLSGGEQQRVALGRSIVREPKVFIMDEPLSNLDAKLRLHMRTELKALQKKLGITTIYVTHDQVEAMTMADRIAIMNEGSIQQIAPPDAVYAHPSNEFVAGFIGSPPMNFIPCSTLQKDGRFYLDSSSFLVDVTDLKEAIQGHASGPEVTLGVRPEDISLSFEKVPDAISGQVYVVEPLGAESIVDVKVDGLDIRALSRTKLGKIAPGQKVDLVMNKKLLHVFDKKTGITLV